MNAYNVMKEIMKDSGKSITDVADEIGVSRQSLYRSLHGGISLDRFNAVCKSLGVEVKLVKGDRTYARFGATKK